MAGQKVVVYIASSLDGYIAEEDESLEWLFQVEGEEDHGYRTFYETVDMIVMGRKTYDWVMDHEKGKFPYTGKDCYVFTTSSMEATENVNYVHTTPTAFLNSLDEVPEKRIWLVGGGKLIQAFLKENLIDEFIITVAPWILGKGIPLFLPGDYQLKLGLKGTTTYGQFVELHYLVKK